MAHRSRVYAVLRVYAVQIDTPEAEAARAAHFRAAALGATARPLLRAPGGHLLCVLPVESDPDLTGQYS
ncbi:hypothetical protein ABZT17_16470 [Streptomyces sp. NPDC005648]|uniref:hypothetical protein n=1 Tax=Streptomyces sp. NPDC005648 TaxID=3157044 RepID=UPI0033A0A4E5